MITMCENELSWPTEEAELAEGLNPFLYWKSGTYFYCNCSSYRGLHNITYPLVFKGFGKVLEENKAFHTSCFTLFLGVHRKPNQ